MKSNRILGVLALATGLISACNSNDTTASTTTEKTDSTQTTTGLKEETVSYTADSLTANGYIVYNGSSDAKRPAVLVVHEWWGQNEYVKRRARQLAELGYIAMAVDMFGNGKTAANPQEAQALAGPYYGNVQLTRSRLEAALNKLKENPRVDTANVAAIGYCFGGFVVLNAAKLGAPLKGVVSFHGNLSGAPVNKDLLKAQVLVAHGADDSFVPPAEVAAFRKSMDAAGAVYTFKAYPGATHAFTNPDATAAGKKFNLPIAYNGAADTASWNDMKAFFNQLFR